MTKLRVENAVHLGTLLEGRKPQLQDGYSASVVSVVQQLQALARKCHRNAERMCNGELEECQKCHGDGHGCKKCRETGYPTLAREEAAVDRMRDTLKPFRLRLYEQGDPRGWPLYLIPEESGPASEDGSMYNSRGVAVCPH